MLITRRLPREFVVDLAPEQLVGAIFTEHAAAGEQLATACGATCDVAPEVMVAIAMYAAVATARLLRGPPRLGSEGLPLIRVRPERQRGDGAACSGQHVLVTVSTDCHGVSIARECDSNAGWPHGYRASIASPAKWHVS